MDARCNPTLILAAASLDAIIFDFDGTIIDSESADLAAWIRTYSDLNLTLPFEKYIYGVGAGHLVDLAANASVALGSRISSLDIQSRWDAHFFQTTANLPPRDGLFEFITSAEQHGVRLAIASNSSRNWITNHLDRLKLLHHFEAIISHECVSRKKPSPDAYIAALVALSTDSQRAIAVEDSPNGIAAAKQAGLYCIAVANAVTCHLDLQSADARTNSFKELTFAADDPQ